MEATIEILKKKIEILSPDLLEILAKILDKIEKHMLVDIPQFQIDEVIYRIQFHTENPATKLDFFDNLAELERICA